VTAVEQHGVILIVAAVGAEGGAVRRAFGRAGDPGDWTPEALDDRFELVVGGVGKANAAGALARFYDPARHLGAMSVGVCGSLPGGPAIGASVLATSSVNADEGLVTPDGFITCRQMGFPLGASDEAGSPPDVGWAAALRPLVDAAGPIATVSVCSGTDAAAGAVARRTGAIAEAMEGAAIAQVLARVDPGAKFCELRVVSNTTGDRDGQVWDLASAFAGLTGVLGRARTRLG